jgi:3-oxoacyl-[acyl-carrier-protein] synthase-3
MYISAVEYYLPEDRLTNEQISHDNPEWSIEKISAKTGILSRPIAEEGTTSADLAFFAAEKLFNNNSIEKNGIDFLLLCTQSPDYFLPTTACILQERLGLSKTIGALDFNLGCSGYVYGLALAKSLVVSHIAHNVLLLTGETYSKFINAKDKSCRSLFGDGASATLITSDGGIAAIGDFCLGTDGKGADSLIIKNGAFRNRKLDGYDIKDSDGNYFKNDNYLYMNGNEIFDFTTREIPGLINETLKKNKKSNNEIDLYVFHQANKYMLNFIRKIMHIPEENFYINLENTGNTVSSTIPIALKQAIEGGNINKGFTVIITGFGVGYSYGSTVLQF